MTTFHRRPQFQAHIYKLPSAEREDDQMPTENLSALLGRVSENSTSQIDDLVGDFGRLREKLRIDGDRIRREVEEYQRTEPTGDATDENHFRKRGESSSISGSTHNGLTSGPCVISRAFERVPYL
jgi:hypothetical protein